MAIITVSVLEFTDFSEDFSLSNIQKNAVNLKRLVNAHYLSGVLVFIGVYVFVNLWFPAAAVLTLLAGFLYGTVMAVIYVDASTVLGSLLAFWISKYFAGKWVQNKWHGQLMGFNKEVSRRGSVYLLLVRLIPMMPFLLVNFLAGLTRVPLKTFIWTTALGSLPGILIFSYAGHHLLNITSMDRVVTPKVIIAFILLAVFAGSFVIIKKIMFKNRHEKSEKCQ